MDLFNEAVIGSVAANLFGCSDAFNNEQQRVAQQQQAMYNEALRQRQNFAHSSSYTPSPQSGDYIDVESRVVPDRLQIGLNK